MYILQKEYLQVTTVDLHVAEETDYNFNQYGVCSLLVHFFGGEVLV